MLVKKKKMFLLCPEKYILPLRLWEKKEEQNLEEKTEPPHPLPHQKIKWSVPKQVFSWRGSYGVMLFFSLFPLQ